MGKRLSQLNEIEQTQIEDYLLVDGDDYLESKKIKLGNLPLSKFNNDIFYDKSQIDNDFVHKENGKQLTTNDFTDEYKDKLENSQEKLVDGDNVKTINGESILGEGNLEIQGGSSGDIIVDQSYNPTRENAQSGIALAEVFAPVIKQKLSGNIVVSRIYRFAQLDRSSLDFDPIGKLRRRLAETGEYVSGGEGRTHRLG